MMNANTVAPRTITPQRLTGAQRPAAPALTSPQLSHSDVDRFEQGADAPAVYGRQSWVGVAHKKEKAAYKEEFTVFKNGRKSINELRRFAGKTMDEQRALDKLRRAGQEVKPLSAKVPVGGAKSWAAPSTKGVDKLVGPLSIWSGSVDFREGVNTLKEDTGKGVASMAKGTVSMASGAATTANIFGSAKVTSIAIGANRLRTVTTAATTLGKVTPVLSAASAIADGVKTGYEGIRENNGEKKFIGAVKTGAGAAMLAGTMTGNPVLVAGGAIAYGGAVVYENREAIGKFGTKVGGATTRVLSNGATKLSRKSSELRATATKRARSLRRSVSRRVDQVRGAVSHRLEQVKSSAVRRARNARRQVSKTVREVKDYVGARVRQGARTVSKGVNNVRRGAKRLATGAVNTVRNTANFVRNTASSIFRTALRWSPF